MMNYSSRPHMQWLIFVCKKAFYWENWHSIADADEEHAVKTEFGTLLSRFLVTHFSLLHFESTKA